MKDGAPLDLEHCDREPIHVPGNIQPHGVLVVLHEPELEVIQVSANVGAMLGREAKSLLGRPLGELVGPEASRRIAQALRRETLDDVGVRIGGRAGGMLYPLLHRHRGVTILELEPAGPELDLAELHRRLRRIGARVQAATSVDDVCGAAVTELRRLLGFDRVVVYRFDEDEHGAVVAEDRNEEVEPYLGLHFPATDIPKQARELYRLNPLRLIPEATYVPVPLVPEVRPDNGEPLDMSFSLLRSVSPIHREYLSNMGLRASMSLSIVCGGRLWGLLSCGHRQPRFVPFELRSASEIIARLCSLQIALLEEQEERMMGAARRAPISDLVQAMRRARGDVLFGLREVPDALIGLVGASGAAVCSEQGCERLGSAPPLEAIQRLVRWLSRERAPGVFHTSELPTLVPEMESFRDRASGVLALTWPPPEPRCVLWFRPEVLRTVNWGGDPNEPVEARRGQLRPRRSFESWKEVVRGTSGRWGAAELGAAADLRRHAIEIDLERQMEKLRRAVWARDELVAVVSHDLKTPLGVVQMQVRLLESVLEQPRSQEQERARRSVECIRRATIQMNVLTRRLLDFGQIEAGHFAVLPEPEDLRQLVGEAVAVLQPLAEEKRVLLVSEIPKLSVQADRERIFQVLSNLVGNAIRFTEADGTVRIAARSIAEGVEVRVSDTGPGIAPEDLPRLFERYWQVRRGGRDGSGLGLYIAKGIVEAHGGRIWVESTLGAGTTVMFTLLPAATEGDEG